MEVILLKNLRALGDKHDVVSVKNGYGRNYLIPKGLAVLANKPNMAKLDELVAREKAEEDKNCLLYTSPSPRDQRGSRMPSSA